MRRGRRWLSAALFTHGGHNPGGGDHRHAQPGQRRRPALEQHTAPHRHEQQVDEIERGKPAAVGCLIGAAETQVANQVEGRETGENPDHRHRERRPSDENEGYGLLPGMRRLEGLEAQRAADPRQHEDKRDDEGQRQRTFRAAVAPQHQHVACIEKSGEDGNQLKIAAVVGEGIENQKASGRPEDQGADPPGTDTLAKHRAGEEGNEQRIGVEAGGHLRHGDLLRGAEEAQHAQGQQHAPRKGRAEPLRPEKVESACEGGEPHGEQHIEARADKLQLPEACLGGEQLDQRILQRQQADAEQQEAQRQHRPVFPWSVENRKLH